MLNLRALYSASICALQVTRSPSAKSHLQTRHILPTGTSTSSLEAALQHTCTTSAFSFAQNNTIMARGKHASTIPSRRSARLHALASTPNDNEIEIVMPQSTNIKTIKRKASTRAPTGTSTAKAISSATKASKAKKQKKSAKSITAKKKTPPASLLDEDHLPRTREKELLLLQHPHIISIIGIDEAGRGPLAGPVIAAAAIIPMNIPGITDSKQIKKESHRDELYDAIVSSPYAKWAVAVADAGRIDEINILQATLECMSNAAKGVMEVDKRHDGEKDEDDESEKDVINLKYYPREKEVSPKIHGCYIVCGMNDGQGKPIDIETKLDASDVGEKTTSQLFYALVDGNRIPENMPCDAEPIVKGDSKEYAIAAASVLAKVSRDRLMHEYDALYPHYNLKQHKGYPTKIHMAKVREFGASPIHRRTFAPLKHMVFDDNGKIVEDYS
eukprot:scaffold4843_cov266-Chaetoceros_neogracile.AAC.7